MKIEVEKIELIHKKDTASPVLIKGALVGSIEFMVTRKGTAETLSLKEFSYMGFTKISWLKFSFPDAAILSAHSNDAETFLMQQPDYFRVRFSDAAGHSELFQLPWLGESETRNEGVRISRPDTDVLLFEAGFDIT